MSLTAQPKLIKKEKITTLKCTLQRHHAQPKLIKNYNFKVRATVLLVQHLTIISVISTRQSM